jgi:hypothetical protein
MANEVSKPGLHGQKMIEVKVRFWTNDIAGDAGKIVPKHARTSGVVRLKPKDLHGIKKVKAVPFHSLLDLPAAIEKLLIRGEIQLHASRKMKKLLS